MAGRAAIFFWAQFLFLLNWIIECMSSNIIQSFLFFLGGILQPSQRWNNAELHYPCTRAILPAAADSYPETAQKPVQCVIQLKPRTFLLSVSSGSCCLQNSLLLWACFVHIIVGRKGWNVLDCLLKCIKCFNSVNAWSKYIFLFYQKRIQYSYCLWINILFYIYFFCKVWFFIH